MLTATPGSLSPAGSVSWMVTGLIITPTGTEVGCTVKASLSALDVTAKEFDVALTDPDVALSV